MRANCHVELPVILVAICAIATADNEKCTEKCHTNVKPVCGKPIVGEDDTFLFMNECQLEKYNCENKKERKGNLLWCQKW